MAKITRRIKAKDILNGVVTVNAWSLNTPPIQYTATYGHYGRQAGASVIHFAQVLPSGKPMNALAVVMPTTSVTIGLLGNLGAIRERLIDLEKDGKIEDLAPGDLDFGALSPQNYVQKTAEHVRAAIDDTSCTVDFFKFPVAPRQLLEAQPDAELEIDGVVRVTTTTSLFSSLIKQMEQVESYDYEAESDEAST